MKKYLMFGLMMSEFANVTAHYKLKDVDRAMKRGYVECFVKDIISQKQLKPGRALPAQNIETKDLNNLLTKIVGRKIELKKERRDWQTMSVSRFWSQEEIDQEIAHNSNKIEDIDKGIIMLWKQGAWVPFNREIKSEEYSEDGLVRAPTFFGKIYEKCVSNIAINEVLYPEDKK